MSRLPVLQPETDGVSLPTGQGPAPVRYRVEGSALGEVGLTNDAFSRALLGVRENVHG